jgi:uncharacterized protein
MTSMKLAIQSLGSFILTIFLCGQVFSQGSCFPEKNENRLVYDEAHLLSADEVSNIEDSLRALAQSTGNQIVIVIVEDLCDQAPYEYASELGQVWGVGQEKQDNGVVFLIKPKRQGSKGEAFLAIGRGLEGVLTDGFCGELIRNEFIPFAKEGKYFEAIRATVSVVSAIAKKEYGPDEYLNKKNKSKRLNLGITFAFVVLILFLLFYFRSKKVKKYAKANNLGFWAAWGLMSSMSHGHRGYYSNFRSGSGGFGGFGGGGSGGGFGGFGGGGFGGGGGGGSW